MHENKILKNRFHNASFFYKLTNYAACSHKHVFWIINIRR